MEPRRWLYALLCVIVLLTVGASHRLGARGQQGQQAPPPERKLVVVDRAGNQDRSSARCPATSGDRGSRLTARG